VLVLRLVLDRPCPRIFASQTSAREALRLKVSGLGIARLFRLNLFEVVDHGLPILPTRPSVQFIEPFLALFFPRDLLLVLENGFLGVAHNI